MNHDAGSYGELFGKVLGVTIALLAWYRVLFPVWGKDALRSIRTKIVRTVATTAWCLPMFGVYPTYATVVLGLCFAAWVILAGQDRRAYHRLHGIGSIKPLTLSGRDLWLVFGFFDALTFATSGAALIRDLFSRPVTNEQHILHVMTLGLFTVSVIAAIALLLTRPPKNV